MTAAADPRHIRTPAPAVAAGLAFVVLYAGAFLGLVQDWWTDPDAGHGLLLFPLGLWLLWRSGREPGRRPAPGAGLALLAVSLLLGFLAHLAVEPFTLRISMIGSALALALFALGWRQLGRSWLGITMIALSIPLPQLVLGTIALPLQLQASRFGAALLAMRHVPVRLMGNVIALPHRELFVTEACSGLRSITALLALGILIGALWMRSWWSRAVLLAAVLPVAVVLNGLRVFFTGFFVFYVNPTINETAHAGEGLVTFIAAFLILGVFALILRRIER